MKKIFIFILLSTILLKAQDKAILWLPYSNEEVNEFLNKVENTNFKLAIALSNKDNLDTEKIQKYQSSKNIEIINIPEAAPYISLLYYPNNSNVNLINKISNNPYFFALRINEADLKFKEDFGKAKAIVLPYGDINKEYIQIAKAYGYSWLPSGLIKGSTQFQIIDIDSVTIVPFKVLKTTNDINGFDFYIIDNTLSKSSESINMLINMFLTQNNINFILPSQLIDKSTKTYISFNDFNFSFQPWKTYNDYLLNDEQYFFAINLSNVRKDIISYTNTKPENLKEILIRYIQLEKYFGIYPNLENKEESEQEIIRNLEEIYQIINSQAPNFIYQPFKNNLDLSDRKYEIIKEDNKIIYRLIQNNDEKDSIKITTFSVSLNDNYLEFETELSQIITQDIFLEIYIDINSRIGSGSIKLLEQKTEKIIYNNAWEYALSTKSGKLILYQSAYNKIIKLAEFNINKSQNKIFFKIPTSLIKGNYKKWNYIPILFKVNKDSSENIDGIFLKKENGYIYPI